MEIEGDLDYSQEQLDTVTDMVGSFRILK
jgi:hypothetical protein